MAIVNVSAKNSATHYLTISWRNRNSSVNQMYDWILIDQKWLTYPTRILRIPPKKTGTVETSLPMLMMSSCCSTACVTSCAKHLLYRMCLISCGDSGLSITSSSLPNTPIVTCKRTNMLQVKVHLQLPKAKENFFLSFFLESDFSGFSMNSSIWKRCRFRFNINETLGCFYTEHLRLHRGTLIFLVSWCKLYH